MKGVFNGRPVCYLLNLRSTSFYIQVPRQLRSFSNSQLMNRSPLYPTISIWDTNSAWAAACIPRAIAVMHEATRLLCVLILFAWLHQAVGEFRSAHSSHARHCLSGLALAIQAATVAAKRAGMRNGKHDLQSRNRIWKRFQARRKT